MKKTNYVYCKKKVIMEDDRLAFKCGNVYKVKHSNGVVRTLKDELNDGEPHTIDDNTSHSFFIKHFRYINVIQ